MTDRAVPKSLHTVTVLVNVARELIRERHLPDAEAVQDALRILGHDLAPDPHNLAAAAHRQLKGTSK